jgi:hypothetical protein
MAGQPTYPYIHSTGVLTQGPSSVRRRSWPWALIPEAADTFRWPTAPPQTADTGDLYGAPIPVSLDPLELHLGLATTDSSSSPYIPRLSTCFPCCYLSSSALFCYVASLQVSSRYPNMHGTVVGSPTAPSPPPWTVALAPSASPRLPLCCSARFVVLVGSPPAHLAVPLFATCDLPGGRVGRRRVRPRRAPTRHRSALSTSDVVLLSSYDICCRSGSGLLTLYPECIRLLSPPSLEAPSSPLIAPLFLHLGVLRSHDRHG